MTSLILEPSAPRTFWPAWREHGTALGVAVALHAGLAYVLLNLSHTPVLPPAPASVMQTQLVSLPTPAPEQPSTPVASPAPPPVLTPEQSVTPTPVAQAPAVDDAALALKRVQQERRERQQRLARERLQRQAAERREQLAREEQAREARLQEERLAQARKAQSVRQAAADRARAEAEAASRQYLPIAKEAPEYPQRALDRRIEGECTVAYTVDTLGRVTDPRVVGNCHPLLVKPSLTAAKRFRYQPKVVNGQAVAVANVKNTFSYRIE
ncbi:energy transducer TonB [Pseudomonas sp. X10]